MTCDPRPQRGYAERRGIIDPSNVERRLGCGDCRLRRRGRRLPHLHVNNVTASSLDSRRCSHHVHNHERRNRAAAGR